MVKNCGFTLIDLKSIEEKIKKSKGTEEEPFEGEVRYEEMVDYVSKLMSDDRDRGNNYKYILDNVNAIKDPQNRALFFYKVSMPVYVISAFAGNVNAMSMEQA